MASVWINRMKNSGLIRLIDEQEEHSMRE